MQWALVDKKGVVVNMIHYTPSAKSHHPHFKHSYKPPRGLKLKEVEDTVLIGDTVLK